MGFGDISGPVNMEIDKHINLGAILIKFIAVVRDRKDRLDRELQKLKTEVVAEVQKDSKYKLTEDAKESLIASHEKTAETFELRGYAQSLYDFLKLTYDIYSTRGQMLAQKSNNLRLDTKMS
jgi:hypothetical protein